jgi:hypothetical protein
MNFQSPQLLTDLYSDLRDRRLLPLIVVLLAGMVLVPIALSKSSKSPPPTAPGPVTAVPSKSSVPATQVALSDPGLRDYRRRLSGDAPQDPFLPQLGASFGSGSSTAASSSTGGLTPTGGLPPTTSSSGSNVGLTAEGKAAAAAAGASTPTGGSSTQSSPTPTTTSQNKYFFYRVKLRTGEVGQKMTVRDSVGTLTPLPSKNVPALEFLGVTTNSSFQPTMAVFLVSSAVSSIDGEGTCTFAGTYCQILSLKPGEHEDLVWTDGRVFRVDLVNFDLIVRNNPPSVAGQGSSGGGSGSNGRSRSSNPLRHHFSF